MVQSDALSRSVDLAPDMDDDNDDRTLLPDSLFVNMIDTKLNDLTRKTDRTDPQSTAPLPHYWKEDPSL